MKYQVTLGRAVDFSPDTEVAEVLQNIRTILSTRRGTVPLDRDFGISWDYLDKPYPVARALMRASVIEAIEKYEPRATVESVDFDESTENAQEGILRPRLTVSIGEEE